MEGEDAEPRAPGLLWALVMLLALAMMLFGSILEPVIPDADDCDARGLSADCWTLYDENGHRVMVDGLRRRR